jgi:serine/threonine-protein kinase
MEPLVNTTFSEQNAVVSPDGRWFAYQSNETGRNEIHVRPFPDAETGHWMISTGGGTRPLWARNGREIFYLSQSGALMSVPVEPGERFSFDPPRRLFEGRYFIGTGGAVGRTYDVSPDGQRFLMIKPVSDGDESQSIVVVQNWQEELKQRVPTR